MPGDLNLKKSWNPALMKNQKKVWEREQQALKELQTIKQRQKEIAQEREKEEMLRLQYGSDPSSMPVKDKLELNKLGWMYNDGPKDTKEDESGFREVEEDFLANSGEIEQLLKGSKAVKTTVGSRFDKVASVGVHAPPSSLSDDPLLAIRRQQFQKRGDQRDRSPGRSSNERRNQRLDENRHRSRESRYGPDRSPRETHRDRDRDRDRDSQLSRNSNHENHRDTYLRAETHGLNQEKHPGNDRYHSRDKSSSTRPNPSAKSSVFHKY